MRKFSFYAMLLALLLPVAAVSGQESRPDILVYGDTVEDEITNSRYEVFYSLKAEAGAVLLLELVATEDSSELDQPEIVVYNPDETVLADTLSSFDFGEASLVVELPASGLYPLLVTRKDGRAGDSVGAYRLRVIRPVLLLPGETINDAALNDTFQNYYLVRQGSPFTVFYEFSNGELDPVIEAYRIEEGGLVNVATLRGRELRNGAVGLDGAASPMHVFTVGDSPFASYFDDRVERADYRLRLEVGEG